MQSTPQQQCPHCGAWNNAGQAQCSRCGAPLGYQQQQNRAQSQYNGWQQQQPFQPSPQWYANDPFATGPQAKSRGVTALLAILLGGIGVQYFYLGKIGAGIITIVLTVVTCGLWEIISLIQGILMFCMDNRTFNAKYVETQSSFPLF